MLLLTESSNIVSSFDFQSDHKRVDGPFKSGPFTTLQHTAPTNPRSIDPAPSDAFLTHHSRIRITGHRSSPDSSTCKAHSWRSNHSKFKLLMTCFSFCRTIWMKVSNFWKSLIQATPLVASTPPWRTPSRSTSTQSPYLEITTSPECMTKNRFIPLTVYLPMTYIILQSFSLGMKEYKHISLFFFSWNLVIDINEWMDIFSLLSLWTFFLMLLYQLNLYLWSRIIKTKRQINPWRLFLWQRYEMWPRPFPRGHQTKLLWFSPGKKKY